MVKVTVSKITVNIRIVKILTGWTKYPTGSSGKTDQQYAMVQLRQTNGNGLNTHQEIMMTGLPKSITVNHSMTERKRATKEHLGKRRPHTNVN